MLLVAGGCEIGLGFAQLGFCIERFGFQGESIGGRLMGELGGTAAVLDRLLGE